MAFEGVGSSKTDGAHSLMVNQRDIHDDDWCWLPTGGKRSIADIVEHVAWAKYMYADCGFGEGTLDGRTLRAKTLDDGPPTMSETIEWLNEGHRVFRSCVEPLLDEDWPLLRKTNRGEMKETRWLIDTMIEHDLYHAGEINHFRALRQSNDAWPF